MPPTHWPSPPFFEHLLYESPWALVFCLLVVALTLHLLGAQRNQSRVKKAALLLVLLALGAPLLAYNVQTDREAILARTQQFIAAAKSPQDTATLKDSISNFANFEYYDADGLRRIIDSAAKTLNIEAFGLNNTLARIDNPKLGLTYASGTGRTKIFGNTLPFKTQFILKWRKDDDQQWRITEIVEFTINDRSPLYMMRMLGR